MSVEFEVVMDEIPMNDVDIEVKDALTNSINEWFHLQGHICDYKLKISDKSAVNTIKDLLEYLKDHRFKLYRDFIYKILVFLMCEKFVDNDEDDSFSYTSFDIMYDQTEDIIDETYRQKLRLYFCGFNFIKNSEADVFSAWREERLKGDTFLKLLEFLKGGRINRFESLVKEIVNDEKKLVGKYYVFTLKEYMIFFYQIAKKNKFFSFENLIFRMFPVVGKNSNLFSNILQTQSLVIYDIKNECKNDKNVQNILQLLGSSNTEDVNIYVKRILDYKDNKKSQVLIFGRNEEKENSLLELILSSREMSKSIKMIWKKFDLKENPLFLSQVKY